MSADCFLRVIRIEGIQWDESFHGEKPRLYVRVQLRNSSEKTREIKSLTGSWNDLLILPQVDTSQDLSIKLFHHKKLSLRSNICLGSLDIRLDELLSKWADDSGPLSLMPGDKDVGSPALHIQLLNPSNMSSDIKNDVDIACQAVREIGRSSGSLSAVEQGASRPGNGKDMYKSLEDIAKRLSVFVDFMDELSKINPYANTAWKLTISVYKVVKHQKETDDKLVRLASAMKKAYDFVKDAEVLRNKAQRLWELIEQLLRLTAECCHFVLRYCEHDFLGRMFQMSRESINEFTEHFDELRRALDSDVILHTAIVSEKIYEEVDLIYLEGVLKPHPMDAFERGSCLQGTREEVLKEIMDWIESTTTQNILWLRGVAGSGKSTITTTIARRCNIESKLGAFVFFNREGGADQRNSVFRTIAFQLAKFDSSIGKHVTNAVKQKAHVTSASAEEQFNALLLEPLKASSDELKSLVVIIVEALDEYGSPEDRRTLMSLLKEGFGSLPSNFRFLFTSRPEPDIFRSFADDSTNNIVLAHHSESSKRDVRHYIDHKMREVIGNANIPESYPWDEYMDTLAEASEGLFIWASTTIELVSLSSRKLPKLREIISKSHSLRGLDQLYKSVLADSRVVSMDDPISVSRFSQVMCLILHNNIPLSDADVDVILGFSEEEPSREIFSKLQSVLVFVSGEPIRLLHASFADYLEAKPCFNPCSNITHQKPSDCLSHPWPIDFSSQQSFLALRCFTIMKNMLHLNMCGLETSFELNENVPGLKECIKNNIPAQLAYACMYWADHLKGIPFVPDSQVSYNLMKELNRFVYNYLLHWLEVLSFLGETRKYYTASRALRDGAAWTEMHNADMTSFIWGASNLVQTFADPISGSTPHIYVSMIPLMKEESKVAAYYSQRMVSGVKVERLGAKRALALSKVLEGHTISVQSVAVSSDGKCIASGSWDATIRIWDIQSTRITCPPLEGHEGVVNSVAFSQDGQLLVSGSGDKMIRIWNVKSGEHILMLEGHSNDVTSVAFSPSGTLVASGSEDKTIRVWDAESGRTIRVIEGHSESVRSVVFTPHGGRIVSCSDDETIRVWDTETGHAIGEPFIGHTSCVCSVSVSPDGACVVSGSWDRTVRVWDIESGKIIFGPFQYSNVVTSVAFSPDGKRIVSGSWAGTIVVWGLESRETVCGPLTGHTHWVYSVAFTPDGKYVISCSNDETIRIWDTSIGKVDLGPFICHTSEILSVAYSPDGTRIVSSCMDGRIGLWDVETRKRVCEPFIGHQGAVSSVAFSPDGRRFVSGSDDRTVIIWDVKNGKIDVGPLTGHTSEVNSVDFSPDGECVVSCSREAIIIWDAANGEKISQCGEVHVDGLSTVRFSPDGKLIASASTKNSVILRNTETGNAVSDPVKGEEGKHMSAPLAFSPDGKHIASRSGDDVITVRDVVSGNIIFELLAASTGWISSVAFSPDGLYIAVGTCGTPDSKVMIWGVSKETAAPQRYKGHSGSVTGVAFSPDGSHIVSCSTDKTIRIWEVISKEGAVVSTVACADTVLCQSLTGADETCCSENTARDEEQYNTDWSTDNGWIVGPGGKRLLWIPNDIRCTLLEPRNTAVLNCEVLTKLDFKDAALGKRWQECYDPTIEVNHPEPAVVIINPDIETTSTDLPITTSQTALISGSASNIHEIHGFTFLRRLVDLFSLCLCKC